VRGHVIRKETGDQVFESQVDLGRSAWGVSSKGGFAAGGTGGLGEAGEKAFGA